MPLRIVVCFLFLITAPNAAYSQTDPCDAFDRGSKYRYDGILDKALTEFTKAIDLKCPNLGQAYFFRGEIRWGQKDYDGAWADVTTAIPILEKPGPAYLLRGHIAYSKKDYKAALTEYSKAIEIDPADRFAVNARLAVRKELGDLDGLIADYTRLIEIAGKDDVESHIARANVYLAKGDKTKAFADFDTAVKIAPSRPIPYVSRGYAYYSIKRYPAAVEDLKKALAISPRDVNALHHLGHVYHDQQLFADALTAFTSAIKEDPKAAKYYLDRGLVYRDRLDLDRARADVIKASQLDPANADIRISAAWVALLRKNFWDAESEASGVMSRHGMKGNAPYAAIVEYLALRMNGKPADAAANVKLRIKASTPGAWTDSLLKFLDGQLTAARLLAAAGDDEKKTEGRSIIGIKALLDGQPAVAKTHLDWINANGTKRSFEYSFFRLLSESGTSPAAEALYAEGNDHFQNGDAAKAIASYTKAIAADPNRPEYLLARAKVNISMRKPVPARQDIDRSIAVGVTYEAYELRANIHIEGGGYSDAIAELERAAAFLKPSTGDNALLRHEAHVAGLYVLLGKPGAFRSSQDAEATRYYFYNDIYEDINSDKSSGRYGNALARATAAVTYFPDDIVYLLTRGEIWIDLGRAREALADFDKALVIKPKQYYSQIPRGKALLLLKRYTDAIAAADIAIKRLPADDPSRHDAYAVRAEANCALGNKQEAAIDEAEFLRLGGTIETPCR